MKIEDYKHADCSLYRSPAVDFSDVNKIIEQALIENWQKGNSADTALKSVLSNEEIVNALKEQIAPNLNFQRSNYLAYAQDEQQAKLNEYLSDKENRINQIKDTIGARAKEQEDEIARRKQELYEKNKGYFASQARLEEMRSRIRKKLGALGGEDAFRDLLAIDEIVTGRLTGEQTGRTTNNAAGINTENKKTAGRKTGSIKETGMPKEDTLTEPYTIDTYTTEAYANETDPDAYASQQYIPQDHQKYQPNREYATYNTHDPRIDYGLKIAKANRKIDPLKKPYTLDELKSSQEENSHGTAYKVVQKIWKVLNYKIW